MIMARQDRANSSCTLLVITIVGRFAGGRTRLLEEYLKLVLYAWWACKWAPHSKYNISLQTTLDVHCSQTTVGLRGRVYWVLAELFLYHSRDAKIERQMTFGKAKFWLSTLLKQSFHSFLPCGSRSSRIPQAGWYPGNRQPYFDSDTDN